jgi:hypothetical protein
MSYYCEKFDKGVDNVLPSGPAGVALAVGDLVYMDSSGNWQLAVSAARDATRKDAIGIVTIAALQYEQISPVRKCHLSGFTSLTIGAKQYLSATGTTGNTITATKPADTVAQLIGFARSATEIEINVTPAAVWGVIVGTAYGATAHSLVTTNLPVCVNGKLVAAVASNAYATGYFSTTITATQTNDVSAFAVWGELYITPATAVLLNGNYSAVWGNTEMSGTVGTNGGSSTSTSSYIAGVSASITAAQTTTIWNICAGMIAIGNLHASITNSGVLAAFAAYAWSGKKAWECGLYLENVDNVFEFNAASTAYESGVKIGSITNIGTADGVFRIKNRSTGTLYYVPLFAAGTCSGE